MISSNVTKLSSKREEARIGGGQKRIDYSILKASLPPEKE